MMAQGPHLFSIYPLLVGKALFTGRGIQIQKKDRDQESEFREEGENVTQIQTRIGLVKLVRVLC